MFSEFVNSVKNTKNGENKTGVQLKIMEHK